MCYTPFSGKTSCYVLKTVCFFQCCCVCYIGYVIEHKIHNIFVDSQFFYDD